ncbi:hypothetical protein [Actinomadura hibisca]|uniref:hypothetical protein n=1 Tax=Actinomadura hibisca TaxID=68565 RepID=UPI000834C690|nr:hypothetical protein [Actinomadura hibisca]
MSVVVVVILVLLCLVVAGGELYLAFDRKRTGSGPGTEVAELRRRLNGTREELAKLRADQKKQLADLADAQERQAEVASSADSRVHSLIAQINERMVPEINDRLRRQKETADLLGAEVIALRTHLVGQLDQAVAASLGADPVDTIAGALAADSAGPRGDLARAYERFAGQFRLRVELTAPADPTDEGEDAWQVRYYLSGRSPRALERDFFGLLHALRSGCDDDPAVTELLRALRKTGTGGAQLGPLLLIRTPNALLCGVLTLAELRRRPGDDLLTDPLDTATKLHHLPEGRFFDATDLTG